MRCAVYVYYNNSISRRHKVHIALYHSILCIARSTREKR